MQKTLEEIMSEGLTALGISLQKDKVELYFRYLEILLEWNKKFNLTAIVKPEEIIEKHFLDSIAPLPYIMKIKHDTLIDVGTGAGFPGVPLKIAFSGTEDSVDTNIVLLDSLKKRIQFLEHLITELKLVKIQPVHGRAEDYGKQQEYREKFDIAVSRAVSGLAVLSEYCLPFVKVGGIFIVYKGPNVNDELMEGEKAVRILGGTIAEIREFTLPGLEQSRNLIIILKTGPTPDKFPRKAGVPEKRPLS